MSTIKIKINDVIKIMDEDHKYCGHIVIVDEVDGEYLSGRITCIDPESFDGSSSIFVNINTSAYKVRKVGNLDEDYEDLKNTTNDSSKLEIGDIVEIRSSDKYDRFLVRVSSVQENSFIGSINYIDKNGNPMIRYSSLKFSEVVKVGSCIDKYENPKPYTGCGRPLNDGDINRQKLCKEVDNLISKYGTPSSKTEISPDERTIEDLRDEIYIIKKGLSETEKNSNNDPTTKGSELGMNSKIIELQKELLRFVETQKSFNKTIADCWRDNKKKIQQLHSQKGIVHRRLNEFEKELEEIKETQNN